MVKKIFFVSSSFPTFAKKDYGILHSKFNVRFVQYEFNSLKSLLLLMPRIIVGVIWADISFSWFGSFHAFFTVLSSRILKKKSVVVAGGHDVAKIPEINYGLMNKKLWRFFPLFSFKNCDRILAVSQYTKNEVISNTNVNAEKVLVVRHGFDENKFFPKKEKKNIAITVATMTSQTLDRKGIINFARTAKLLPNTKFYLIGKAEKDAIQKLRRNKSRNLFYKGFVSPEELVKIMQRAKVYVQISAHEGFGCSLAEAMLCECIPVVTACGAIPEVVGDAGYYVPYGDIEATAKTIERALKDGEAKGENARKRIEEEFPIEKRRKELIEVVMRL